MMFLNRGLVLLIGALITSAPIMASVPFSFDSSRGGAVDSRIYPISSALFNLVLPDGSELLMQRSSRHPNMLVGKNDWLGQVRKNRIIVYQALDDVDPEKLPTLVFHDGLLTSVCINGCESPYSYSGKRVSDPAGLFPKQESEETLRRMGEVWNGDDGRLRLWYKSPNQAAALMAVYALLLFGLFWTYRDKTRWLYLPAIIILFYAVLQTGSRGAMLALGVGLGFVLLLSLIRARSWRVTISALVMLALMSLGVVLSPYRARFTEGMFAVDKSNSMRLERWAAAPKMMVDAPWGWKDFPTGVAYGSWYQAPDHFDVRRTLVSTHADVLVRSGWIERFVYLFIWFGVLYLFLEIAWQKGVVAPSAVGLGAFILFFFNDISVDWALLIGLLLPLVVMFRKTTGMSRRRIQRAICVSVACTSALIVALYGYGCIGRSTPTLRADGSRVLINGKSPTVWLVEDALVLGGWQMSTRDLRAYYSQHPQTQPLGFVRRLADLPQVVDTAVICGRRCQEFLDSANERKYNIRRVVFLSPSFPVATIPEELREKYRISVWAGRLALADDEVAQNTPEWLQIVSGAQLFMPDWVERVTRL